MDAADEADRIISEDLERKINAMKPIDRESATQCAKCGEEVPEARRIAVKGCQFCVDCQDLKEISYR